jgi:hypothetical protein
VVLIYAIGVCPSGFFPGRNGPNTFEQLPGQIAQGADDFKSRKGKMLMQKGFFAGDILLFLWCRGSHVLSRGEMTKIV